ncbi:MAG: DUF4097 family beta strand repeat-containing protein, partial [Candidatus Eisenbacteria bacterium]
WNVSSYAINIELYVPKNCTLDLKSVDGSIRVREVDGNHVLAAVDGSIEVRSVAGNVKCHSVDGSCRLIDVTGNVDVKTTDGSIELDGIDGDVVCRSVDGSCSLRQVRGAVEVSSTVGSVRVDGVLRDLSASAEGGSVLVRAFEGSEAGQGWRISSVDGSVTLRIAPSLSALLEARTDDGHVFVSVPVQFDVRSRHRTVARIGDGSGSIRISTDDGSISITELEED